MNDEFQGRRRIDNNLVRRCNVLIALTYTRVLSDASTTFKLRTMTVEKIIMNNTYDK